MTSRVLLILAVLCATTVHADFDTGRAPLALSINNEIYPYREFATYVLPEEHLGLCIMADDAERYQVVASDGLLDYIADCRWLWTAPAVSGQSTLRVLDGADAVMEITVFVLTPAQRVINGRIGNFLIGDYPAPTEAGEIYQAPDGYIEVSEELLDIRVSPHFVLGQFVTVLDNDFPKYIVLRERLLLKLEAIMERLSERGIDTDSLAILKGYITPAYNAQIGGLPDSRHMYGGAATLIVDRDNDGRMDDLDNNGVLDNRDGQELFDLIDELYSEPGREHLRGGLYLYSGDATRGPSVMLDARGFRKRWPNSSEVPPLPANLSAKHRRQFP